MKKILILFCCLTALLSVGCVQKEPLPEEPSPELEAVDMGLSVKWGSFNVGASRPEDFGNRYAWGETWTKTEFKADFSNYFFYDSHYKRLIKYCADSDYGFVDNKTVLEPMDDVASVLLGSDWRIPTDEEWAELADTTNCEWTYESKISKRYVVTSKKTNNSIILPLGGDSAWVGEAGSYWSSSLYEGGSLLAYCYTLLEPRSPNPDSPARGYYYRRSGYLVRPVSK